MKDIIIIGAGDLGKDVAWLIERINEDKPQWNLLGFTEKSEMKEFQGYPILGDDNVLSQYEDVYVVCALANTELREKIIDSLPANAHVATLIDPRAIIHRSAQIGEGSMVFANALVGIGARLGKQCIVLYNASVNHDVEVGDYTTIYPNATVSGRCVIGKYCEIGTGASLIQHITICDKARIGVGAAVFTKIKYPGTTVGNPAVTMGAKKKESE